MAFNDDQFKEAVKTYKVKNETEALAVKVLMGECPDIGSILKGLTDLQTMELVEALRNIIKHIRIMEKEA